MAKKKTARRSGAVKKTKSAGKIKPETPPKDAAAEETDDADFGGMNMGNFRRNLGCG